ncbi:hypothetical protein D1AOALGA4SA_5266 [Olavius algarvensis Delta 1 endosymbiont]|nr:hypothetical protein D1AOALGA4SA_5266 [Olavius algarvensis Delta 1 endosymbiont]
MVPGVGCQVGIGVTIWKIHLSWNVYHFSSKLLHPICYTNNE